LALADFVRRRENRELLDRLTLSYSDGLDPAERRLLDAMRRRQRQLLDGYR